ncbi:hypothetical protein EBBID32_16520 [Sphingobium indicum BiD32]|uniref:Uncharacterized protein n=1 Tax=Sphingobium indicum BiD32 TaxID=1301087 RepID=N1MPD9_9SPHN|nr:hypothetical protein [Sphingobium indicum]CCW17313.1 hypothetical protein EBBID32_16520 [Sphingobium indicum BiD32]
MTVLDLDADIVELAPAPIAAVPATPLREMAYRVDAWTPQESERLRSLFLDDVAIADIGQELRRSRAAVAERIALLGLRRNSTRTWTELDDAELTRRYAGEPTARIASDLGRSCSAVYARARLLDLTGGNPPEWTPWEDAQLVEGYRRGVPLAQIATLIGRPFGGLSSRAGHLAIVHANHPPDWSAQETARALELAEAGHRYTAIVALLGQEGFPQRTIRGFGLAIRKLGYGRGWGRAWTPEEDALLRRAYEEGASLTPLRRQLGRTGGSLRHRAEYLQLRGSHANRNGWRIGPDWTDADEARLRADYGRMSTKDLATSMGRTKAAITSRANALGLVHGYIRPFSDNEARALAIAFRTGVSIADLAAALNRKAMSLSKYATNHGYPFGRRPRRAVTLEDLLALECPADRLAGARSGNPHAAAGSTHPGRVEAL